MLADTFPYMYASINLLIPFGVPYSSIQKITLPFTRTVWVYIFVTFLLTLVAVQLIKWKIRKTHLNIDQPTAKLYLNTISICMGNSIIESEIPKRHYARFSLIILVIFAFIIRNAYQGSLFIFLQAQIQAQPVDTLDKIMQYNYTLYVIPVNYEFLSASNPNLRKQLSVFSQQCG